MPGDDNDRGEDDKDDIANRGNSADRGDSADRGHRGEVSKCLPVHSYVRSRMNVLHT